MGTEEEYGRWVDGDTFEFNEPIELAPGQVMRRVYMKGMVVPEGIEPFEIIEALADPQRRVALRPDQQWKDVTCPDCQKTGKIPVEAIAKAVTEFGAIEGPDMVLVRCPNCREATQS